MDDKAPAARSFDPGAERPSGWTEAHRWPPFTHGKVVCKCGAEVARCRCPQGCVTVGTVAWCDHCDPTRAELAKSKAGKVSLPNPELIAHDKQKILDQGYRSAAKRLYPDVWHGDYSNIQKITTGAFVEVHVWVPKEEAEKEGEHQG